MEVKMMENWKDMMIELNKTNAKSWKKKFDRN